MLKFILAGLIVGLALVMISHGLVVPALFLLCIFIFVDWSGGGDGRQRPTSWDRK